MINKISITLFLLLLVLFTTINSRSSYSVCDSVRNTTTVTLTLKYSGSKNYYIKPSSPISKNLIFTFHTLAFNDFTFKIVDADNKRFEVPQYGIFPIDPLTNFSFPIAASAVTFEYNENPFEFRITRKQNGAVLFSTYGQHITFSDHYLEIGT
jgi:alpha-glucosidase